MTGHSLSNLRIDRASAEQHLAALDQPGNIFIFAIIPEAPGVTGSIHHLIGTFDQLAGQFDSAQSAGCGVFVTVNAMTGRRRVKSAVARVRALWCERDGPGRALPLAPSLRIRTSPGRGHEYLICDYDDPPLIHHAERINRQIAAEYGGDRQACDLARVLRLAGSWHLKREAFKVEIIGGTGKSYSRTQLLTAFPAPVPPPRVQFVVPRIDFTDRYLASAAQGILGDLSRAVEGSRNASLNWSAFRLAQLGIEADQITAILAPVALGLGLGQNEITATIRSGCRAGAAKAQDSERRAVA